MPPASENIVLLAPQGNLRHRLTGVLPRAVCRDSALEALAEAASGQVRTLVATAGSLGYRHGQIVTAVRRLLPRTRILVVCPPGEESGARGVSEADGYFVCPDELDELALAAGGAKRRARASFDPAAEPGKKQLEEGGMTQARQVVLSSLRDIAESAEQPPAGVAQAVVSALSRIPGVRGAAVWEDASAASPPVSTGEESDWQGAGAELDPETLRQGGWVALSDATYAMVSGDETRGSGAALVVRLVDEADCGDVLNELEPLARIAVAMVTSARDRQDAVRVLSTDAETGLGSRRYFEAYLAALCRRAAAARCDVAAVAIAPLVEDAWARQTVKALGEILSASLPGAKAARLGEVTVVAAWVASREGEKSIAAAVERLLEHVVEADLPGGVAVGAAAFPWECNDADALKELACERLSESRRQGGIPVTGATD